MDVGSVITQNLLDAHDYADKKEVFEKRSRSDEKKPGAHTDHAQVEKLVIATYFR